MDWSAPVPGRVSCRLVRGGAFNRQARHVRCACRLVNVPGITIERYGFRPMAWGP
jgi:formylglycine-generating enzyme required for sulfatase activity